jgi:uncharacterized protein (DUF1330 family)
MPDAYVIVEMQVSDAAQYQRYMEATPAVVKTHGGEFVARGGRLEVLEGQWRPPRLVVLRFPSYEQAVAFYDAEDYRIARRLREGATDYFNMVVVEGTSSGASTHPSHHKSSNQGTTQ